MSEDGNGRPEHRSTLELVESIRVHTLVIDLLEFRNPRKQLVAIEDIRSNPSLLKHQQVLEALRETAAHASPQAREEAVSVLKSAQLL